jgi:hypothetical protein
MYDPQIGIKMNYILLASEEYVIEMPALMKATSDCFGSGYEGSNLLSMIVFDAGLDKTGKVLEFAGDVGKSYLKPRKAVDFIDNLDGVGSSVQSGFELGNIFTQQKNEKSYKPTDKINLRQYE